MAVGIPGAATVGTALPVAGVAAALDLPLAASIALAGQQMLASGLVDSQQLGCVASRDFGSCCPAR